jgi:sporulation protein YabP
MELSGVEDVVSFDENGAVLRTVLGMLAVDGENLHVVKLDLAGGNVSIEGKVNGFFYADGTAKKAKRFFRGC